ncbi:TraR/DksA family transcriptional regulator [Klebsiella pneumoniae]|nr:TraR/DksA family transcriptional regulator [Klebsiella pneumoniae]
MADAMDIAQQREQAERERLINNARSRIAAPSRFTCEVCDTPIPEARRIAIPGVAFCVTCQQIAELKSKHYRGYKWVFASKSATNGLLPATNINSS